MKSSISFVCQECGYDSPQWLGKCPVCGNWNTLKEFQQNSKGKTQNSKVANRAKDAKPRMLSEIAYEEKQRISSGFLEMDNVLGGGIVPGSVTLLAGDPGIGKSTLLLQTALNLSNNNKNTIVLYVSGEESGEQIKLRAKRIVGDHKGQKNLLLLSISDTDEIVSQIYDIKPSLVIIDSIQTMESERLEGLCGSVGQVRFATSSFLKVAKELGIPIILVGHVTKEGMVAGPMVLSHMVDTVLFFEGERFTNTRILRSFKNRFGPVDEVGIFSMNGLGITEVQNPQDFFLSSKNKNVPGSVLVVIMEGTRPFLVELQALVVYSKFPMPRRIASGVDLKRLELLLAVLQKHCRLPLDSTDVFVNVAGGIKITDPAADLGICLAVYSSLKNIPMPKTVGIAEVGLLGELREISGIDKRIKEAKKLGFDKIISEKTNQYLSEVIQSLR